MPKKSDISSEELDLIDSLVKEGLLSNNAAKKLKAAQNVTKPLEAWKKYVLITVLSALFWVISRAIYKSIWEGFINELFFGLSWFFGAAFVVFFIAAIAEHETINN